MNCRVELKLESAQCERHRGILTFKPLFLAHKIRNKKNYRKVHPIQLLTCIMYCIFVIHVVMHQKALVCE